MPAVAPIRVLADLVVARIAARWSPVAPDAASRVYLPDVEDATRVVGRQVYVVPLGYAQADTALRGEDRNEFRIGVVVVETYPDAGDVPNAWLDERTDFVADLWADLSDAREDKYPAPFDDCYAESGDVSVAYDPETLRELKTFWAFMELVLRQDQ